MKSRGGVVVLVLAISSASHLPATSPAVDAADPAAVLSTDIEGTARPQVTRLDLGAFEYKP